MKYKIVTAKREQELERLVNELISQGWEPLGGVCSADSFMHQAMTHA